VTSAAGIVDPGFNTTLVQLKTGGATQFKIPQLQRFNTTLVQLKDFTSPAADNCLPYHDQVSIPHWFN
jgi:hypothetical protein